MMRSLLAAAAIAALPMAPCLASDPPGERAGSSCFFINQIRGQRVVDPHAILLHVGVARVFKVGFSQDCPQLNRSDPQLITSPASGVGLICHAIDLQIKVANSGAPPQACIIQSLRELTPDEIATLPKGERP